MKPASRISLATLLSERLRRGAAGHRRRAATSSWTGTPRRTPSRIEKQLPNAANARGQAMLHVAMFEAVNAIDRRYAPYKLNLAADRGTSREAARLPRRMTFCWRFIPTRSPTSMRRSRRRLPGLPMPRRNRRESNSARQAAAGIIALRADDGSNAPESYRPVHRARRLCADRDADRVHQREDDAVGDEHRRRNSVPAPPPALNSEVWTRDLNEIREIGSSTSTKRTAEQTTIGPLLVLHRTPHLQSDRPPDRAGQEDGPRRLRPPVCAEFDRRRRCLHRGVRRQVHLQSLASGDRDPQCRSHVQSGDAARGLMAAARHHPDASGISVRALHRRLRRFHGAAERRRQRGRRDHAGQPDRSRRHPQMDAPAGLQRRGFERPHLCRLPLPLFDRSRKGHGQEDRRADGPHADCWVLWLAAK